MAERRTIAYADYDELMADLERLSCGYERVGNWSLGVASEHIARVMDVSLDSAKAFVPRIIRPVLRTLILGRVLRKGMPRGMPAPKMIAPRERVDDAEGVSLLRQAVERMKTLRGPTVIHGAFGKLSLERFNRLQLVHAAHHLSLLVPVSV